DTRQGLLPWPVIGRGQSPREEERDPHHNHQDRQPLPIGFHGTLLSTEHWHCSRPGWFSTRNNPLVLPDSVNSWDIASFWDLWLRAPVQVGRQRRLLAHSTCPLTGVNGGGLLFFFRKDSPKNASASRGYDLPAVGGCQKTGRAV